MLRKPPKVTIVIPVFLGVTIFIGLLTILIVNYRTANRAIDMHIDTSNRAMITVSAKLMFNPLYELDAWTLDTMLKEFVNTSDILYAGVRNNDGQIVADARAEGWLPQGDLLKNLAQQTYSQQKILEQEYQNTLIVSGPISSGQVHIGTLELVYDLSEINQANTNRLVRSMGFSGLIFASVVIFGVLFTRFATHQLRRLVSAANEIGSGNLNTEIPILPLEEAAIVGRALAAMQADIRKLYKNFEQQVRNVERRASYLEATANLASDAATTLDVQDLIARAVLSIQELFGYYRQSIFLLDANKQWAILRAIEGRDTDGILDQGLRLEVGVDGIVGHVTQTGQAYVVQNIAEDPTFYTGGQQSATQSELVVPLISRGEIIGALDVQSENKNAFSNEDISVLQTLANQLAIAIANATLYQQAQENFERLQSAYTELNRASWSELLRGQMTMGFYCDENGITTLDHIPQSEKTAKRAELSFPVTIRGGQVIGAIRAHKTNPDDRWADSEAAMLHALSEQMSLALESAQLYQDTQRSATREQVAREITDKMRRATTVEDIIQTAVNELYLALGANQQIVATLDIDDQSTPQHN